MITAYSVKPRISRIEENKPKPQFANLDELIAAMKADAKEISKRHEKERPPSHQDARGPIAEYKVYDFIKANPGASVHEIANHFNRQTKSIASLLSRMKGRNAVKATMGKNPATGRPVRCFKVVPEEAIARQRRSQTQIVFNQIKASPGSSKAELAEALGLSIKQIEGALTNMGRYKDRFPIRREYENGIRSTVRAWAI
jgi:transcriptional regulator with XRE-family HTH domain